MAKSSSVKPFQRRLLEWYQAHGRHELPWRKTDDAYAIYISEVMLQQTQVKTVLERYYFPFLKRFPTLQALADANRDSVLQSWQGLGYYSRALNLQKAAQQCGGILPDSVEGLMTLPGIGRNTAHAIASFAYRHPVPVMEANVKRVISRMFALRQPSDAELWEKAQSLLDAGNPFDYNQAMMDLGAVVCTKRNPHCGECPARPICQGQDAPETYPQKIVKKTRVRPKKIVVLRSDDHCYYATPRTGRFLGGLYHFIETDCDAQQITLYDKDYSLDRATPLGSIRQQYSHFTLEADVVLLDCPDKCGNNWYNVNYLSALPMSMAEQKILKLLEGQDGITAKPDVSHSINA